MKTIFDGATIRIDRTEVDYAHCGQLTVTVIDGDFTMELCTDDASDLIANAAYHIQGVHATDFDKRRWLHLFELARRTIASFFRTVKKTVVIQSREIDWSMV